VLAAFHRDDERSSEAGLKYFVLGALSSGLLLYGVSLVYGFVGSTDFTAIAAGLTAGPERNMGALIGLVFVVAGLAFKVSAVPFHMWTPDVYEGAPTPVAAFFATAPKVAAMGLFLRVALDAFSGMVADWRQIIIFMAIASMFLGAVGAIGQANIKRLLAYSSINNIGFVLIGLAAATAAGASAVLLYLAIYLVMTLGAFLCVLALTDADGKPVERLDDLSGPCNQPALAGDCAQHLHAVAGRSAAAVRLHGEACRVQCCGGGKPLAAGDPGRARQRGRGLLLSADREDPVLRSAGRRGRGRAGRRCHQHGDDGGCRCLLLAGRIPAAGAAERGDPAGREQPVLILHLQEVGSTSDWLRTNAGQFGDGQWVRADRQTAGRGRMGRAWQMPPGNLAASCLIRPQPDEGNLAEIGFVAALALHDVVAGLVAAERLQLKWPNDLLARWREAFGHPPGAGRRCAGAGHGREPGRCTAAARPGDHCAGRPWGWKLTRARSWNGLPLR
jgi:hypothetical protein